MFSRLLVLLYISCVAAFSAPGVAVSSVSRAAVSMNTKYTVAAGVAKKKNPNSGRSDLLKGYTVGSLAPPAAVSSGTTITEQGTGYGIGNRWGGGGGKKAAAKGGSSTSSRSSSGGGGALVILATVAAALVAAGAK